MTRLILIRHAKSSWDDPFQDDFARVLNQRSRDAARAIAVWLQTSGYAPDCLLVSTAARTVETAELIPPRLPATVMTTYLAPLYHAAPDTILDSVQRRPEACIAVIAHNPGIAMLAQALVRKAPDHPRFDDYPTCATTVIDFDGQVAMRQGTVVDFIVPRDLIGDAGLEAD